jgi:hypothetical protein
VKRTEISRPAGQTRPEGKGCDGSSNRLARGQDYRASEMRDNLAHRYQFVDSPTAFVKLEAKPNIYLTVFLPGISEWPMRGSLLRKRSTGRKVTIDLEKSIFDSAKILQRNQQPDFLTARPTAYQNIKNILIRKIS